MFVSDSFRSRSRAQICLLERVDSQSAKRGGFQAGRAKLNSDAITQDCASSSALSSELTGAAGSKLVRDAGCHRVRRRMTRYTKFVLLLRILSCIYLNIVYIALTIAVASGTSSNSLTCARLALFLSVENASIEAANELRTLVISSALCPVACNAG